MSLSLLARHPIAYAVLFETALAIMAVVLAGMLGLRPWAELEFSSTALGLALAATAPLAGVVWWLSDKPWDWVRGLRAWVREHLLPLIQGAGPGAVMILALAAGVAEELLFRGVIQGGLEAPLGPIAAVAIAAVLFGLAHCVSWAYFLAATLIGAYLGILYLWTGNLLVPMAVHALYDWVALRYLLRTNRIF